MAHFAKLNDENIVTQVVVVDNNDILDIDGNESELIGKTFLFNITGHRKWRQTSYSGSFRGLFAGVGYRYNPDSDTFNEA
jgi:hypothetical protein